MWGIWNGVTKRFVFGIKEDTKEKAWRKFKQMEQKLSYKYRYEARTIPNGWKNKPNPHYANRRR